MATDEPLAFAPEPIQPDAPGTANDEDARRRNLFRRLRQLKASFGSKPNKDEVALRLISACLDEGLDTQARIVAVLDRLDFRRDHVMSLLDREAGKDNSSARWFRDADGRYRPHAQN